VRLNKSSRKCNNKDARARALGSGISIWKIWRVRVFSFLVHVIVQVHVPVPLPLQRTTLTQRGRSSA